MDSDNSNFIPKTKSLPKESVASCTTVHVRIGYDCSCVTNWISRHILLREKNINTNLSITQ